MSTSEPPIPNKKKSSTPIKNFGKTVASVIYRKTGAKSIYESSPTLPRKLSNLSPFIEAKENKTKKCFNFIGTEDNFIEEFKKKIKDYKKKLKEDLSYKYGEHRVFVNTYYLPIMYIIYSFIYKKFYDEQVKRQIIIYTIHKYNKNRLLFDKKSPLIKKVNVFLNTKLNEEKKEEKEELEGGIINQIIENKNILIKFLQEINEKLEKEIDVNKRNQKKYTIFLNDLQLYKDKLNNIEDKITGNKNKNKNISTIINNRLYNQLKNNTDTTLIKSKYEDLIKLQTKINLFLITDNNENTVNFLIKTTNKNNIEAIITVYTKKINDNKENNTKYQEIIDINTKELLIMFENQAELYQDYLLKMNNKDVKKIFFKKIVTIIKEITNKNTELIEKTKNNKDNSLLQLLNYIYTSIGVNISFEQKYLNTISTNQSNPSDFSLIKQKTTKIDFDEKLRHYLKEKKDTNKTIEKKLKEFKEDVDFNLKNISNELAQLKLKEPLTAEEKENKKKLETEYKAKEASITKATTEQKTLTEAKSKLGNNIFNTKLSEMIEKKSEYKSMSSQNKKIYNSIEANSTSFKKLTTQINAKNEEINKYKNELENINKELTKLKKKENQHNYKKQILETKEASYKNIIIEIDSNLKELTATKNATSNNALLKDIFNKVYNNLSDLSNSLDKINKKIQFKQSENKILSLYKNDTMVKMLNDTNSIDTKLNQIIKYFTVKKFDPLASNKNLPKINIFINSFIEEYNKIKDVHNINVELFFNFVFELNNELTTNIIFILEQIKEHNLQKKSFLNTNNINNPTKIKYLTDIKNSIKNFYNHIEKNKIKNENKENKKSNSKIKKILAYTDVINLYLSNIIYLTAYLSTFYL